MPTHETRCVVCGGAVYCTQDEHGLGVGGPGGKGGCGFPPYIEFCSLAHAEELQRRLAETIPRWKLWMKSEGLSPTSPQKPGGTDEGAG